MVEAGPLKQKVFSVRTTPPRFAPEGDSSSNWGSVKGYVPDEEVPGFYNLADALVFPSLYEGFGIPVLEAMACGCPVAASTEVASPEVAGGAALLVDPYDPAAIAEGMRAVVTNSERRARMTKRGTERAAQFSWEATARRTLRLFELLAGEDQTQGGA
jgi:glycosyltransferase involved in cell wall biosynthesis